ncbi:MAG: carboxypeptidase M32 [Phycisphaerales bacterium]|nr:carboxypeptidase M32 [Phycisphaerales bacterium]
MTNAAAAFSSLDPHPLPPAYGQLASALREANLLRSTGAVLTWDQETMAPPRGIEHRSRQLALLARLQHERTTDPRVGDWLGELEADRGFIESGSMEAANVREARRDYLRETRLPVEHVSEFAEVVSNAQQAWIGARRDSDFPAFEPWLTNIVALTRDRAALLGTPEGGEPWDALADAFEPGCTAAHVTAIFTPLRARLVAFIAEIAGASRRPSDEFNDHELPLETQQLFVRHVIARLGFDLSRGRLDTSTHPFCGSTHCHDVRLTTRYDLRCVNDALGSSIHEAGHGMYEQGLPEREIGLPSGTAVSLGIHESQSRMWENQVGRSRGFWQWCTTAMRSHFAPSCDRFSVDELYGAANVVKPGLIRVDADEATYNLHVMVRFELERRLVSGALSVGELPGEWNRLIKEHLGVTVPNDRLGCLQDVHWSMGAFGYFPTYTLGTLYAAQFHEAARREIPGLEDGYSRGEFEPLLRWLNAGIHAHGRRYSSAELCQRVTGATLSAEPFMAHLEGKLRPLYGL